jgi:D-lactate dehydrogenase (cytochrome)
MVRRALSLRGTSSGEHGVGLGKMRFVAEERGEVAMDLMRKIKYALDPHGIMNPFKVFAPLSCEEGASASRCTRKHDACSN